ncbi:MAG: hypothetical protein AVDCRST_MAG93-6563 [uncultured Chloroflexia bacterium]|uniref:Uncharacterized protein n=1 Tax=uncultured Chloroflexia bacterium TaxID=1672391 RepID=A0A6J4LVQ7_9CHLR|nr:MAG: hypothetical protein AVDCRST_MAG93-6563 [uncultured Chloroflexia bacterium]
MATASIPAPSATRKRTPPSPQRVYETWQHECRTAGEWGAYARTAARYHKPSGEPYSDEWARKLCKRWEAGQLAREAAEAAPVDDTLAYQAPPGGYPQPQPAAVLRQADAANSPTSTLKAPTIGADLPTVDHDITAAANVEAANSQPANRANSQPFELEEAHRPEDANWTPATVAPRPPAGIVHDYLKHSRATVERDGLLLLAWRWVEAHPLIGPLPSRAIVVLLAGLVLAWLAG